MLAGETLVVGTVADTYPALGRQHKTVSLALKPGPKDFLTSPRRFRRGRHRVGIGRIKKLYPMLACPVENGNGGALITLMAKRHPSQSNLRDLQAGTTQAPD